MTNEKTPLIGEGSANSARVVQPSPASREMEHPLVFDSDKPVTAEVFQAVVEEVKYAISIGVLPTRISQGSSGSYFCRDRNNKIVGVFKPKNEEPYGQLNPKWTKWFHRTCCPCFFGRECLIPNIGYISEASASVVDQKLELLIVPRTEIVKLSSPTFYYPYYVRRMAKAKGESLPEKIGSFQIFVNGYKDSYLVLRDFTVNNPMPAKMATQFRLLFERLVILDYLTRNTDRGNDNWLLKIEHAQSTSITEHTRATRPSQQENTDLSVGSIGPNADDGEAQSSGSQSPEEDDDDWDIVHDPSIKLAAIDNGLSFPWKHPDNWRAYPFGWAYLPAAKVPFSNETANTFLPKLVNPDFVESLIQDLRVVAQVDSDFNEKQFLRQMAVLRGQLYNLVEALMKRKSPWELVLMPPLTISHVDLSPGVIRRFMSFRQSAPWFSGW